MQPTFRRPQCEFFGAQLSELLNPELALSVVAERIDCSQCDTTIDACYAESSTGAEHDNVRVSAQIGVCIPS